MSIAYFWKNYEDNAGLSVTYCPKIEHRIKVIVGENPYEIMDGYSKYPYLKQIDGYWLLCFTEVSSIENICKNFCDILNKLIQEKPEDWKDCFSYIVDLLKIIKQGLYYKFDKNNELFLVVTQSKEAF